MVCRKYIQVMYDLGYYLGRNEGVLYWKATDVRDVEQSWRKTKKRLTW